VKLKTSLIDRESTESPRDLPCADVLLIDDDPALIKALVSALSRCGYAVMTASTGRAGLDLLARTRFHLVITDIFMPEIDGVELIMKYARTKSAGRILAMTGDNGYHDATTILKMAQILGCQKTLLKPFNLFDFLEAVYELMQPRVAQHSVD